MNPTSYEFVNYFVAVTSAGISFAIAILFFMAFRRHKTEHTIFRALGFAFIGEAFGFHLFERSFPELTVVAYVFELIGLLFLYYSLLLNNEEGQVFFTEIVFENRPKPLRKLPEFLRFIATAFVICCAFALIMNQTTGSINLFTPSLAMFLAILSFEVAYLKYSEFKNKTLSSKLTIFVILGFIFFGIRHLLNVIFTLPADVDIPNKIELTSLIGPMWLAINIITLMSFLFLAIWQWGFVRKRFFIRVVEVLLSVTILLAISSSAIIGVLGSNIIKDTNLTLVKRNSDLIKLFFTEKLELTANIADAVTSRPTLVQSIEDREGELIKIFLAFFSEHLDNASNFRIYDRSETVIFNPYFPSEQGLQVKDKFIEKVFETKKTINTFGIVPGTNIMAGRSLSPYIVNGEVEFVCAINFYFDDNFLKEIKNNTDIDIIVYKQNQISASTINSKDIENTLSDTEVIDTVLSQGNQVDKISLLGTTEYFTDYSPIKDVNGEVTGILASLRNRDTITDYIRKQLNITFVVITNIAFGVTVIAYIILKRGYKKDVEE